MRLGRLVSVAAVAVMCCTPSALAAAPRVPVVRCPTSFGVRHHVSWPASATVLHSPSSVSGLAAYSNSEEILIAPAGMECAAAIGADATAGISVWPRGGRQPGPGDRGTGLSLTVDPDCTSCQAATACPFFPHFAASLDFPCSSGVPAGERTESLGARLVAFEDPPGVAGSGLPSGGAYPANGVVAIAGSHDDTLVFRATCTLPQARHSLCTTILDDAIARYR